MLKTKKELWLNLIKTDSGANYKELCQSYVIFISNFDPFEQERCVYDFENREATDPGLKLNDGTRKLFFNTRGEDKDKIDPRLRKNARVFCYDDCSPL